MRRIPRVFTTYAQDGAGWQDQVIDFACLLDRYVNVEGDFFHFTEPGMDWPATGRPASAGPTPSS